MKIKGIHMNGRGEPVDRSDLEDAIMKAWRTTEDIKAFYMSAERMDEDQVINAIICINSDICRWHFVEFGKG